MLFFIISVLIGLKSIPFLQFSTALNCFIPDKKDSKKERIFPAPFCYLKNKFYFTALAATAFLPKVARRIISTANMEPKAMIRSMNTFWINPAMT